MANISYFPVLASSWFCLFFGAEVCIFPFLNLFLFQHGISQAQIGVIGCVRPWAGMLAAPLISMVADKWSCHRSMMLSLLIAFNFVRLLLLQYHSFIESLLIIVACEILGGPVNVFVDAKVTQQCKEEGDYGKYRLWGAIGWGGMSWLAGLVMDRGGIGAAFGLSLCLLAPTIVLSWILMSQPSSIERKVSSPDLSIELKRLEKSSYNLGLEETSSLLAPSGQELVKEPEISFWTKLNLISRSTETRVFLLTAIVMGFGFGVIEGFLFLMLKDMGATDLLLGLTLTVTCCAEVPSFLFQGKLIKLFGTSALLDLCCVAYVIRMMLYSVLPGISSSPWLVLLIEPLHGLTFACGWGAGTETAKRLSPPGLESTCQGLFQGAYFGLGYGLGVLMGGLVSSRYGYSILFGTGAATVLVGWASARALRIFLVPQSRMGVGKGYLPLQT